jgi:glycine reductase
MGDKVRALHYLNQFFAGIGGEEKANIPVQVIEGVSGPGRALQQKLGEAGTVVATVVGGDNYVNEERDDALTAIEQAIQTYNPDVIIAGPAFNAGRYGLACGEVCRLAAEHDIPSVTAMYHENPGVLEHAKAAYIIPTSESATDMMDVLDSLASLALKMGRGEKLGSAETEGYMHRGIRRDGLREQMASVRAVDMLTARLKDDPFITELPIEMPETVEPAPPVTDLQGATVALVTTGGLVPKGNPDRLVRGGASEFFRYSIEGLTTLSSDDWESVHRGFYTNIVNQNPDYILPLNVMREMEEAGEFRDLYPWFFSTSGVGTAVAESKRMGEEMAQEMKEAGVRACVLVAT